MTFPFPLLSNVREKKLILASVCSSCIGTLSHSFLAESFPERVTRQHTKTTRWGVPGALGSRQKDSLGASRGKEVCAFQSSAKDGRLCEESSTPGWEGYRTSSLGKKGECKI